MENNNMHPQMVSVSGNITTIDFRHSSASNSYWARCVWQVLFDYYRNSGGNLANMDNLLCDLAAIERWISDRTTCFEPVYWSFHDDMTDIYGYPVPIQYRDSVKISRSEDSPQIITLELIKASE